MKHISVGLSLLSTLLVGGCAHTQGNGYFGQKPPNSIPEIFAPAIVSINGRNESAITFSPELDEIYFHAKDGDEKTAIYFSKHTGLKWTPIEKADFTNGEIDEEANPFVSPDGKKIYFTAYSSDLSDTGGWYVNRLETSWSEAVKLELSENDDPVFFANQAINGNIYYFNISKMKLYAAAYRNGGFLEPKEVKIAPGFYHFFTSPNEDYSVGHGPNKEDESRKDRDIYVSFKEKDGTWANPISLGNVVNSNFNEGVPTLSPDGKFLFFSRDEEDGTENIYWVSTEIISELKRAHFKTQK